MLLSISLIVSILQRRHHAYCDMRGYYWRESDFSRSSLIPVATLCDCTIFVDLDIGTAKTQLPAMHQQIRLESTLKYNESG